MSERPTIDEHDAPWYIRHNGETGHDTTALYGEPQRCLDCGAEEPA